MICTYYHKFWMSNKSNLPTTIFKIILNSWSQVFWPSGFKICNRPFRKLNALRDFFPSNWCVEVFKVGKCIHNWVSLEFSYKVSSKFDDLVVWPKSTQVLKSVNLQYNTLFCWADGTNISSKETLSFYFFTFL